MSTRHAMIRALAGWMPTRQPRSVVLLYHSVHPTAPHRTCTPDAFALQMQWLNENCTVMSLDELWDRRYEPTADRPAVAVTFDDGFADNHEFALPILAEAKIPAVFFLTTGLLDDRADVRARFARFHGTTAAEIRGLSWSQVKEMLAEGMVIGGHTVTHPNLAIEHEHIVSEIKGSCSILSERLGVPVDTFAYPFGKPKHNYNSRVVDAVAKAGLQKAVTVTFLPVSQSSDRFRIPRFAVKGDAVDDVKAAVHGDMDLLGYWQAWAPRFISARVSAEPTFRDESSLLKESLI